MIFVRHLKKTCLAVSASETESDGCVIDEPCSRESKGHADKIPYAEQVKPSPLRMADWALWHVNSPVSDDPEFHMSSTERPH